MKLMKCLVSIVVILNLVACAPQEPKVSINPKPGFSNVTDIAMPKSAQIELNKTMIMGGHDHWTGHLVYTTKESPATIIDFVNTQMQELGWTKISVLRGAETNFTFTRHDRVANLKISELSGFLNHKTIVSVDMANTNVQGPK